MAESTDSPKATGPGGRSSTGLDENLAGALAYFGVFISGIALLVLEKESSYVRFHALQSTVAFLGLFVIELIGRMIPLIGPLLTVIIPPAALILWIVLMVKAYQGERWQLPLIGEIAEERSEIPR
jgi:uncharacterized membrane protein